MAEDRLSLWIVLLCSNN